MSAFAPHPVKKPKNALPNWTRWIRHIYRYGDASRLTAKQDTRGFMLFTCDAPHLFIPQKAEDKAALSKAVVVRPGDARFGELDSKYVADCHNPFVKSAIPNRQSSR